MSIPLSILANTRIHKNATASASPFGAPDGVASAFSLVDRYGFPIKSGASVTAMHRTDWQGRQLLYPTARTNYCFGSGDLAGASFITNVGGTGSVTRTSSYATAPDGTLTAARLQFDIGSGTTSADLAQVSQSGHAFTVGATMDTSVWLRTNDGSTVAMRLIGVGSSTLLINITPAWQRFDFPQAVVGGSFNFRLRLRGGEGTSSHADVLAWGVQTEVGSAMTSYIPVPSTTPITVTDYTYTSAGAVTLGQVPLATATLDWDGTGLSVG